jgi:GMP synthase (glutamine-hydrolysing)
LPIVEVAQKLEECTVKHYTEVSEPDLVLCSKVILSGTALKDNVTLEQPEKFQWLKTLSKPVLGICAGMQTIGVVFGLKLPRCLEIGVTEVETLMPNQLFSGTFKAYSLHNFSVESSVNFEVLAESEKCLQVLKHKQMQLYGILFHPEVRNADILKRFIQMKQLNSLGNA